MGLFKKASIPAVEVKKEPEKIVELKSLLKWEAPVRPFKKRDKDYYTTIAAIVFLLAVILLFLNEWLLIAVMVALMFVAYVLATVPPEKTEHEITTRGLVVSGKSYKWSEMSRFWFTHKWGESILNIETNLKFPERLMLLLGKIEEQKVKELLEKQIQYEVPKPGFMDRASRWLAEKIPLEAEN